MVGQVSLANNTCSIDQQQKLDKCSQDLENCKSACHKVIDAADKVIQGQKATIDLYKQKDAQQTKSLVDLSTSLEEKNQALGAWYHNPFILTTLGLLVGAAGATYLMRR